MRLFKGFDKNMQCRGFQYAEGETYHSDKASLCEEGFHACEMPLDVLNYYRPADGSIYREVEMEDVTDQRDSDSKRCGKSIKIGAELGIRGLVNAQVGIVIEKSEGKAYTSGNGSSAATSGYRSSAATSGYRSSAATSGYRSSAATSGYWSSAATSGEESSAATSGYRSSAATSGYRSSAATSGDWSSAATSGEESSAATSGYWSSAATSGEESSAATSGDWSSAATSGYRSSAATSGNGSSAATSGEESSAATSNKNGLAVACGKNARAKGALGSYIVVTEWDDKQENILAVCCGKIDGDSLKPDTWYIVKDGKFVEVTDEQNRIDR